MHVVLYWFRCGLELPFRCGDDGYYLDLGMNDCTVVGFAEQTKNERLAYDCYRRFIALYGSIVNGMDRAIFSGALDELKKRNHVEQDIQLTDDALKELCNTFKGLYAQHLGKLFLKTLLNNFRSKFVLFS